MLEDCSMMLWYRSLNPVVGRFGTKHELNSDEGTITSHFKFKSSVMFLNSWLGTITSHHWVQTTVPKRRGHDLN